MRESDCFIQHSITDEESGDEEGLPVAILEAMPAALPVISTRHAGIPDAVSHGVTGLLVEEGDILGMAGQIHDLGQDFLRRVAMGNAGWARARERFTWDQEKQRLQTLLTL
jgi:glycosyltransferase involved in cell wall biosynthesis